MGKKVISPIGNQALIEQIICQSGHPIAKPFLRPQAETVEPLVLVSPSDVHPGSWGEGFPFCMRGGLTSFETRVPAIKFNELPV